MPGNDSFTKLLLHLDGADAVTTIKDNAIGGTAPQTVTVRDEAQIDTAQSKFGGASCLFDNEGSDALDVTGNSDLALGSGDWVVDFWYRPAGTAPNGVALMDYRWSGSGTDGFALFTNTVGQMRVFSTIGGGGDKIVSGTVLQANTWYHFALVHSSGVWTLLEDGVSKGTFNTSSTNFGSSLGSNAFAFGGRNAGGGSPCNGHMDEIRISKGTDRGWTSGFTPSTTPYLSTPLGITANTKLVLHFEGSNGSTTFTDSSASPITVTPGGGAQISTGRSKFGSASGKFDAATSIDYLSLPGTPDIGSSDDFVIDFWFYLDTSVSGDQFNAVFWMAAGALVYFSDAGSQMRFFAGGSNVILGETNPTRNVWNHGALTRKNGITRLWLNAVQEGAHYVDSNAYAADSGDPTIGATTSGSGSGMWGNIDEYRIQVGDDGGWGGGFELPTSSYIAPADEQGVFSSAGVGAVSAVGLGLNSEGVPASGLTAWFRADSEVTESAGRVSAWGDKTANGYDLAQSTGGNQPLLVADGLFLEENIPVIRFTSSRGDTMARSTTPAVNSEGPPICYAAVCRITPDASFNWLWGSNDSFRCIGMSNSNQYVMFFGSVVGLTSAGASPINNTFGLLLGNFDGASSELFWNGRSSGTVDSGTGNGNKGLRVGGGGSSAGDPGDFDVAELFFWDRVLSQAERDALDDYVLARYGPLFTARYRSDNEVTDAGAGAVSAWGDMGPGGFDLAQATSGERPTLIANGGFVDSSIPSIRLTRAAGSNLERATTPAVGIPPYAFAAYFTGLVAHSSGQWFVTADGSYRGVLFSSSETPQIFAGDTDTIDSGVIDGNPHSIVANIVGGTDTASGYIDGVAGDGNPLTVNSGGGADANGLRVGDPTSGVPISIDIAEFLFFDHALSVDEVAWLQAYFVERYETAVGGVLASDGVATVAFAGNASADAVVASDGVATAAFTGGPLSDAALASIGVATGAFVGTQSTDGVLSAIGEAAAAFVGAANAGILQSDGIGAAAFVGALTIDAVWTSNGVAVGTFTDDVLASWSMEGVATVDWVSRAVGGSYWYEETAVDNTWTPEASI